MKSPSDYLTRQIAKLRIAYRDDVEHIDSSLLEYLNEDCPVADDEFYFLLKGRLEATHPKPFIGKGLKTKRRDSRRTSRR